MLFDLFKAVGPVLSIRVCRDNVTRRSLGYAYVNFQNPSDAERALETLNYHQIKGKPIRIMWSHRDPSLRKSGAGNVFIKNLHKTIDNQTLYDTFSQFGNILSCKVATDLKNESRGYGFVHFESEESAKAAIEKVHEMLLKSLQVYVGRFIRRSQRLQQNQAEYTNIYVKELKTGMSEADCMGFFSQFGPMKSSCLKVDKKGRPFAFIDYEKHDDAIRACDTCHEQHVPEVTEAERKLYVTRAQKKSERQEELKKKFAQLKARRINEYSGSNLYVKNLDDTVTDEQLREAFTKFGDITSARVMTDDKVPPQSKGFGFVCFKEIDAANESVSKMNGTMLGSKPLYVNVAQRKEVRRATLEIQYAARVARMPGPNVPPQAQPMSYQPGMAPAWPGYFPPTPAGPGYMTYPPPPAAGRGLVAGPKWAQQPGVPNMGPPFPPPGGMPGGALHMGVRAAPPPGQGRGGGGVRRGGPQVPRAPVAGGRGGGVPKVPAAAGQPSGYVYSKQARNKDQMAPTAGGAPAATPQAGIPGAAAGQDL